MLLLTDPLFLCRVRTATPYSGNTNSVLDLPLDRGKWPVFVKRLFL